MRKITLDKGKFKLEDQIEAVIEGKIKPIGNGAMMLASKKFVGRRGYILVVKD